MWFKNKNTKQSNEQLERVISILSNCEHLVLVTANKMTNKSVDYRFLDMTTGYYWQISSKDNAIYIKTGDTVLSPNDSKSLVKMLDIEIVKSAIYKSQKQIITKS